jgi:hypothetical protein
MQFTCPCCFARFSIEAALTDDAARKAVAVALKLPAPLGDLILRYMAFFRPSKRALSWDRAAKLLSELVEPIQAARVERHGRAWHAPIEYWRESLEQMLDRRDKLQLPLKSHGYLFEIVAGIASKAEGRAETATEQEKRPPRRSATAQPVAIGKIVDPSRVEQHLEQLKVATKSGKGEVHE